jgi:hypothetical protein
MNHISLGTDFVSKGMVLSKDPKYQKIFDTFRALLGEVASGGSVVLLQCLAGNYLGPAMADKLRCDINIYMNSDYTRGVSPNGGTVGIEFDKPLDKTWEYQWNEILSGTQYKTLMLNSNGSVGAVPK